MSAPKPIIVLAHGIAPFDAVQNWFLNLLDRAVGLHHFSDRFRYFRNITTYLEGYGFTVYSPRVPFADSLESRAISLAGQLEQIYKREHGFELGTEARKVHIIGHSMGGLDARYAIAKLGSWNYVRKLTTIGTPHLGSSFADWGMKRMIADPLLKRSHPVLALDGLRDLTTKARAKFNDENEQTEAENPVRYQVYGGSETYDRVADILRPSAAIIAQAEQNFLGGANDGLVSLWSQRWTPEIGGSKPGDAVKTVDVRSIGFPLDHLNECGWWDPREPEKRADYEEHVKRLYLQIAEEGTEK